MINLSDVHDFSAARFILYWVVASVVAVIVAYSIGQESCALYQKKTFMWHFCLEKKQLYQIWV